MESTRTKAQISGWALIASLDLDAIKVKLLDREDGIGWSLDQVEAVEVKYRQYLFLNWKYPDLAIVPSKEVDKFWHFHILDTRKYADDCQNIFGRFLHNFPYFGMRGEEDKHNLKNAFIETNRLMREEFGEHEDGVEYAWCSGQCNSQDCGTCGPRVVGENETVRPKFDREMYQTPSFV